MTHWGRSQTRWGDTHEGHCSVPPGLCVTTRENIQLSSIRLVSPAHFVRLPREEPRTSHCSLGLRFHVEKRGIIICLLGVRTKQDDVLHVQSIWYMVGI